MAVRRSLFLSFITFRRTHELAASTTTRSLRLCAFRTRSRNTCGFEPLDSFELPIQELLASVSASAVTPATGGSSSRVQLRQTRGSVAFQWIDSALGDAELAEAASRSRRLPQFCLDASSWSVEVTSYGRSNLSKEARESLAGGPIGEFLSTTLEGERITSPNGEVRIRVIEDTCPPAAGNIPHHVRKRPWEATAGEEPWFYICRELQIGPAVGSGAEMGTTCRRPVRGVLSTLALNKRRSRGGTAIEPEIALVMANLARVRPGSRVLDPFCGSLSLLLPAAFMGAVTWGSDVAGPVAAASCVETAEPSLREGLEGINRDFESLGLRPPTLAMADVADAESPFRRSNFYDAIITDPPYSIKESAVVKTADEEVQTATLAEHAEVRINDLTPSRTGSRRHRLDFTGRSEWMSCDGAAAIAHANNVVGEVVWSLVSLARFSLKPGGRLCFFLPLRGAEARLDTIPAAVANKLIETNTGGERLIHVYSTKQRMKSQNMCRWLVVLEKRSCGIVQAR